MIRLPRDTLGEWILVSRDAYRWKLPIKSFSKELRERKPARSSIRSVFILATFHRNSIANISIHGRDGGSWDDLASTNLASPRIISIVYHAICHSVHSYRERNVVSSCLLRFVYRLRTGIRQRSGGYESRRHDARSIVPRSKKISSIISRNVSRAPRVAETRENYSKLFETHRPNDRIFDSTRFDDRSRISLERTLEIEALHRRLFSLLFFFFSSFNATEFTIPCSRMFLWFLTVEFLAIQRVIMIIFIDMKNNNFYRSKEVL